MAQRPNPSEAFVLVAEDEVIIRLVAVEALIHAGVDVLEAEHGEATVEVLQNRANEVVALFTDVQMPGAIDGGGLFAGLLSDGLGYDAFLRREIQRRWRRDCLMDAALSVSHTKSRRSFRTCENC